MIRFDRHAHVASRASTVEIFGPDYKLNLKTKLEFELESELENLGNKFRYLQFRLLRLISVQIEFRSSDSDKCTWYLLITMRAALNVRWHSPLFTVSVVCVQRAIGTTSHCDLCLVCYRHGGLMVLPLPLEFHVKPCNLCTSFSLYSSLAKIITPDDINKFLGLVCHFLIKIKLHVPPNSKAPPYWLPIYIHKLFCRCLGLDDDDVVCMWDILKDVIWEDPDTVDLAG